MPGPNANGFASQWNIGFTFLAGWLVKDIRYIK